MLFMGFDGVRATYFRLVVLSCVDVRKGARQGRAVTCSKPPNHGIGGIDIPAKMA